jgi:DNA excision repair protein ERCC-6
VVLDLVEKAQIGQGTEVFFDNLFTSFPLLEKLSEKGIGGTGTVRQNRLNKVPIITKKEMEKKEIIRGHSDVAFKDDTVLVAWRDSKAVYLASNKYTGDKNHKCKRFDRVKRTSVQIPIPDMVKAYNEFMGGVDLLDAMVAVYRVLYRIKKWWFCFYAWSLSVSAVNAWRLRMSVMQKKEPFLDFLRELVIDMFVIHGTPPYVIRKQPSLKAEHSRFDGLNHWITSTEKDKKGKSMRRNCKQCCIKKKKDAKCMFMCQKCGVPLHTHCFKKYHTE